jgi:trk system potassium uptake protein TrkA
LSVRGCRQSIHILQHIRRGKVLSAISIKGEAGEVMEALALPTSDIVSKPLKKISFPKGVHCGRHYPSREIIIIPTGESIIEPDDRIIIFATRMPFLALRKFWL